MKILAVNGSPTMQRGMTHALLELFLEGARGAGAEIESFFLQKKKIRGCIGCYRCWVKTPGTCIQRDDMGELLEKVKEADFLVLGSPVYLDGVTAQLKAFVDRLIPLLDPHFELEDGHVRHGRRYAKLPAVALVSVAGFPEMDNFEPLVDQTERLCRNLHTRFAGWLGRPTAYVLSLGPKFQELIAPIQGAARRAGRELVETGAISPEAREAAARPVFPVEKFISRSNQYWDECIAAGKWPVDEPQCASSEEREESKG